MIHFCNLFLIDFWAVKEVLISENYSYIFIVYSTLIL